MPPEEFRRLLQSTGLQKKDFAALMQVSKTAVNRWCSATANDRVPAPIMAVAFLMTFRLLSPTDRILAVEDIMAFKASLRGERGTGSEAVAESSDDSDEEPRPD